MSISMLSREPVGVAGALLLSVLVFPATAIEVRWVPSHINSCRIVLIGERMGHVFKHSISRHLHDLVGYFPLSILCRVQCHVAVS